MKKYMILLWCLLGCRAVKTSVTNREEVDHKAELNAVAVKGAVRETEVLTYWPDGRLYQFEQLRERVDEAALATVEIEEKRKLKIDELAKERTPVKAWIYVGIGLAIILVLWIFRISKG